MTQETFERELARRADHVHGVPLSFDDVRGRARSIQRRRRAAVAAAVAAVVALVVLVPTVLSGHRERGVEPAPAPRGHTAVLHGGVVTLADGHRVDLGIDNADVTDFSVLTDGRIVVAMQEPYAVRVYGPDGSQQDQYPVQLNALTTSADDTMVAWVAKDFTIRVLESGTAEPVERAGIPMPGESPGSIDAVLDDGTLLVGDFTTTTGEVTDEGYRELTASEPLRVTDVGPDGDAWAVGFPPGENEQFGCAGVYDPKQEVVVARTCDTSALRFAPDGRHLIGTRGDNNMAGEVSVLDLDLQQVGRFAPGRGSVVSRVAWADADHLLVAVAGLEDSRWSLERVGLAGTDPEVVEGPVDGRNAEIVVEYLLAE